jgi:hypothetical protein
MSLLRQSPSGGPVHSPDSDQGGGGAASDWPATSAASSSSRLGVVHSSPASPAQGPLSLNSMQIALMALKVRVVRTRIPPASQYSRQYFLRIRVCVSVIRIADLDAADQFITDLDYFAIFVVEKICYWLIATLLSSLTPPPPPGSQEVGQPGLGLVPYPPPRPAPS